MQEKRKRGRPATGRIRDKKLNVRLSDDEYDKVKQYLDRKGITATELVLKAIKK